MRETHNTLPLIVREQSQALLNTHLAAAIDLHAQVKQAHWNVRGPGFIALHLLFDRVADAVETFSDMLAERAGGLGGTAHGTIQMAVKRSYMVPYTLGLAHGDKHVFAVAAALAAFGQAITEAIRTTAEAGDPATADLLTEILRGVDAQLWFVESNALAATDPLAV